MENSLKLDGGSQMKHAISTHVVIRSLTFLRKLSFLFLSWQWLTLSASAQTTTTSDLLGTVTDPQALPIVGVKITVTDVSRGYTDSTATNNEGFYRIKGLLPGTYKMKAEMAGFQTFVNENVIVYTRQERRVDIQLKIGEITEQVTVEAQGSVINTES